MIGEVTVILDVNCLFRMGIGGNISSRTLEKVVCTFWEDKKRIVHVIGQVLKAMRNRIHFLCLLRFLPG